MFALPVFLGRPMYCRGVGTVRWTVPATSIIVDIKEKNQTEVWFFVFALPIFPGRPTYCPAVKTCRWHVLGRKKPYFRRRLGVRVTYLPG